GSRPRDQNFGHEIEDLLAPPPLLGPARSGGAPPLRSSLRAGGRGGQRASHLGGRRACVARRPAPPDRRPFALQDRAGHRVSDGAASLARGLLGRRSSATGRAAGTPTP